tara:strand:- start:273 stop:863 length:591 start_codon:yes stop_codon:yes gene_type:complete
MFLYELPIDILGLIINDNKIIILHYVNKYLNYVFKDYNLSKFIGLNNFYIDILTCEEKNNYINQILFSTIGWKKYFSNELNKYIYSLNRNSQNCFNILCFLNIKFPAIYNIYICLKISTNKEYINLKYLNLVIKNNQNSDLYNDNIQFFELNKWIYVKFNPNYLENNIKMDLSIIKNNNNETQNFDISLSHFYIFS